MLLSYLSQCITTEHVTTLCRNTADTSCEAAKVKLLSILGIIGKMAGKKDNTLEVLKVRWFFFPFSRLSFWTSSAFSIMFERVLETCSCCLYLAWKETWASGVTQSRRCYFNLMNFLKCHVPIHLQTLCLKIIFWLFDNFIYIRLQVPSA